jgi:hypothetical protein
LTSKIRTSSESQGCVERYIGKGKRRISKTGRGEGKGGENGSRVPSKIHINKRKRSVRKASAEHGARHIDRVQGEQGQRDGNTTEECEHFHSAPPSSLSFYHKR